MEDIVLFNTKSNDKDHISLSNIRIVWITGEYKIKIQYFGEKEPEHLSYNSESLRDEMFDKIIAKVNGLNI